MGSFDVHQLGSLMCHLQENVLVLIPKPKGILDDNALSFRADCLAAFAKFPVRHVAINMQQVEYLSSAGIGAVLSLLKRIREGEGRLALCQLAPQVEYTLRLCRLVGSDKAHSAAPLMTAPNTDEAVRLLNAAAE